MRSTNRNRTSKSMRSGREQVADYLNRLEHPMKKEIEEVRDLILSIGGDITEHIKWNAPSFCINDQDRITFNLHGKEGFRLIFHCGSKPAGPTQEPILEDDTGLLEWVTGDRAVVHIKSRSDLQAKRSDLVTTAARWFEVTKVMPE